MSKDLNPTKALIFRITHRDNVPWILAHGLHCRNSNVIDPNFVEIGNPDLIQKRHDHFVRHAMGGRLSDYVPFYFTPFSPMLLNIKTGYNGIRQRSNEEIVILVSSLPRLRKLDVPFVFSDMHAYMKPARFYSDLADLDKIDWEILQRRDWLLHKEQIEANVPALQEGLRSWPGGVDAGARKAHLFDKRLLGLALERVLPFQNN